MSNQYFNFSYDPVRQGFDASSWRTLYGNPVVSGTRLDLQNSTIIHYADILRGDAVFSLNIPAPSVGDSRQVGFIHYNKGAYIYFNILNDVLTAATSNGTTSNSVAITWQDAWTDVDTEFRIKWEAGTATFFIGGAQQAIISDVTVPGDPLSLYLSNSSPDGWFLDYIIVKSIQSYLMNEGNDDSVFGPIISEFDRVIVSESLTMMIPVLFTGQGTAPSDQINITESVTVTNEFGFTSVVDNITITDVPTVSAPA